LPASLRNPTIVTDDRHNSALGRILGLLVSNPAASDVTGILASASAGDAAAADRLLPLVYEELRAQAAQYLKSERPDHTLQATALVHEAYVRLVDQTRVQWKDRVHFFAVAAVMMRRVLVNHAKARGAAKRGGGRLRLTLDESAAQDVPRDIDLVALDEALIRLAALDPEQARLVELRFFAGLSAPDAARLLGISERTLHREWTVAKAWLRAELTKGTPS
jgi:RNA polymerase sigma factor (TIGR02999 family)